MLFSAFQKNTPNLMGLDISSSSIKFVELNLIQGCYQIKHAAAIPLPIGVVGETIQDPQSLTRSIKQMIQKSQTTTRAVAIALPDHCVIKKTMQFPADLNQNELESYIQLEAEKTMQSSLEDMSMDFQILGPSSLHSNVIDVLWVGLPNDLMEQYTYVIQETGLIVKIVDITSYAIDRSLYFLGEHFEKLDQATADSEILHNVKDWMISFGLALRCFDGDYHAVNSY